MSEEERETEARWLLLAELAAKDAKIHREEFSRALPKKLSCYLFPAESFWERAWENLFCKKGFPSTLS
jgi:hypothetical protein